MKKILIIKLSSMGDLIHTFPAINDAVNHFGSDNIHFDWVVEKSFCEIPGFTNNINKIIKAPLRSIKNNPKLLFTSKVFIDFVKNLRQTEYDLIIDAQGLIKSALIAKLAKLSKNGKIVGLDKSSARESMAAIFYQEKYHVPKGQHAVLRLRQLFASALNYPLPNLGISYAINLENKKLDLNLNKDYILFLHGTTWVTKKWPLKHWQNLAKLLMLAKLQVVLPYSNLQEKQQADLILAYCQSCLIAQNADYHEYKLYQPLVLPKLNLTQMKAIIQMSTGIVATDTGLGHLAAALAKPCVSIYGATSPKLTGTFGQNQRHLVSKIYCAPCLKKKCSNSRPLACMQSITVDEVYNNIQKLIAPEQLALTQNSNYQHATNTNI